MCILRAYFDCYEEHSKPRLSKPGDVRKRKRCRFCGFSFVTWDNGARYPVPVPFCGFAPAYGKSVRMGDGIYPVDGTVPESFCSICYNSIFCDSPCRHLPLIQKAASQPPPCSRSLQAQKSLHWAYCTYKPVRTFPFKAIINASHFWKFGGIAIKMDWHC